MAIRYDLTGQKFSRLTVTKLNRTENKKTYWDCVCECGKSTTCRADLLKRGWTQSCGCLQKDRAKDNAKHGKTGSPEYHAWSAMIQRCTNPKTKQYKDYGGRGIRVCQKWKCSFESFYADMGPRPSKGHSIDRKDNDGNYEPGNCRWATEREQKMNTRQNVRYKYPLEDIKEIKRLLWSHEITDVAALTNYAYNFVRLVARGKIFEEVEP